MSSSDRVLRLLLAVVIAAINATPAESQPPMPAQAKPPVDLFGDPLPPGTLARMGTIRWRPGATPGHLLFSADGKELTCFAGGYGSANALVRYDMASGQELRRVELLDSRVLAAAMTADGRGLAVVLLVPGEKNYYLWEFTDPKSSVPRPKTPLQSNTSNDDIRIAISPDGRWVASAGRNSGEEERAVEVRPWTSGRLLFDLKPTQSWKLPETACSDVLFTHDGKELLAACRTKDELPVDFLLFDVVKGQKPTRHKAPGEYYKHYPTSPFALAPRRMLVLGLPENKGRFFDLANDKESGTLPFPVANDEGKNPRPVGPGFRAADGTYLAAGDWDGWLRMWDVGKERVVWQCAGAKYEMRSLVFSPDGRWLASTGYDGLIRLWDAATGKEAHVLPALQGYPSRLEVSHDGRTAVTASNNDRRLRQWDLATGRQLREITHDEPFHDAGFVPGTHDFIVAHGKRLDRWNLDKNRLEPIALEKGQRLGGLFRFSADGTTLVNVQGDQISMWDWPVKKLRNQTSLVDPRNPHAFLEAWTLEITRDAGHALIMGSYYKKNGETTQFEKNAVIVWDTRKGMRLPFAVAGDDDSPFAKFNSRGVFTADQDGVILCMFDSFPFGSAAGRESLRWLDFSGKLRRKFVPPTNPRNFRERIADYIAFSPDGRTLASAERDHTIVLYEAASGLPRRVFEGHRNDVRRLAFTPDGRRLVTFSEDLTGLVWDLSLAPPIPRKLSKEELAQAWNDLADGVDGGKVHRAMTTLAADPHGVVALIRQQLPPARAPNAKHVARLLADLDSDIFDVRTKAFAELDRLGDATVVYLREQLKQNLSLEMRRRVQNLLEKHDPADLPPEAASAKSARWRSLNTSMPLLHKAFSKPWPRATQPHP